MGKKVIVIGSGFAGLSAASFLAKNGWDVTVVEKHDQPGGRARQFSAAGFTFDMGPSWYWMPDVFERYFEQFHKKVGDYYQLIRLDPSYRVYWPDSHWDIPADYEELKKLFEKEEPAAGIQLDKVMAEAAFKYEVGMKQLVFKPGASVTEFADMNLLKGILKLDVFTSISKHFAKHFKSPRIRELMEFPVLFLGALAKDTPALYSLMNYADIKGGTWFPEGGIYEVVKAMYRLAKELGVKFLFEQEATAIIAEGKRVSAVAIKNRAGQQQTIECDVCVSNADYHFTETVLLSKQYRTYSASYWNSRVLAPGCLLFFVGLDTKIPGLQHHSLFFDVPFAEHAHDIYTDPKWPETPLFYVSATSVTDGSQAPPGGENLFFLIPVATGLDGDNETRRKLYFEQVMQRFEMRTGMDVSSHIVYYRSFGQSDFISEYHAFKGNAYGLANTLMQTAILKPACRSKKLPNLFFTGQLTVPGPGVPPSLISGEVVATQIQKYYGNSSGGSK